MTAREMKAEWTGRRLLDEMPDPKRHETLLAAIRPILAGEHPALVSAVLADLLALYLSGMRPELREEALNMHLALMRDLLPINEAMVKQQYGGNPWSTP